MIEKIVYDYLNSINMLAYTEMPKNPPSKFYLIEKTGSNTENKITEATISIQSYADTLYDAISLNEDLKTAMLDGLISLDSISGVYLNSDYNYTDTTTKRYRYQAVFVITYY